MNFTYENQGTTTFLVYTIEDNDEIDSLSLGMITNNNIHGVARTVITQIDEQKYIKFDVSSRVSVKQFFSGSVNKKRLLGVFSGIIDAMLAAEDYMIDPNMFILDLDYMFADVSTCETVLICLPITNFENDGNTNLALFFKNIMFTTQFDQTENCDHVAKIMNYLNSVPTLSLVDFRNLLSTLSAENAGNSRQSNSQVPNLNPLTVTHVEKGQHDQPQKPNLSLKENGGSGEISTPAPPENQKRLPNNPPAAVISNGIPVSPPVVNNTKETQQSQEKKISWFYLMQHYNSENAAAYKAQKEAKKKGKSAHQTSNTAVTGPEAHMQPVSHPTQKNKEINPGFAIPGQATPAPTPVKETTPQISPVITAQKPGQLPVGQQAVTPQPTIVQGQPANFGETTVLNGGSIGETTVLNASQARGRSPAPYLIRKKNNEKIPIDKTHYRIGKERSFVDYFVGDNTAVSRSHADIEITDDGMYFIMDMNSTNHTYVNGAMIQSGTKVRLSSGDKIRLANEDFEFILE